MRILMVAFVLPHPPTSGAAIRISQFTHHLARRHRLTLLCYADSAGREAAAHLRVAGIEVVLVAAPRRHKRAAQLMSLVSDRTHVGGIFHQRSFQDAMDSVLRGESYDAILVESSLLMRHQFPKGIPLVLDELNLEFEVLERASRIERSPLRRFFSSVEGEKFKREEIAAWRRADLTIFTSEREVAIARELCPEAELFSVANGVDLNYFRPRQAPTQPGSVIFTGTMAYRPNVDAVQYLVRDIMPRVRRLRPGTVLTVAGGGVPRSILRLAGPEVVVTGYVDDLRPFLGRAAVTVAPIRFGSGTRLKVLEALAMGKAMVSTTLGCEGLAVNSGEHLQIADDPEDIARQLARLLDNPGAAAMMGSRGRALTERLSGWQTLAIQMESALEDAVIGVQQGRRRQLGQTPMRARGRPDGHLSGADSLDSPRRSKLY